MPTSDLRRFLPSARRACASLVASGLVLALATTTAGAAPAPVESTVSDLPLASTKTTARIVNETVHYHNQIDVEAHVETVDGSPIGCGTLTAGLTDGTDLGYLAYNCSATSSLAMSVIVSTLKLAPGSHEVVVHWEGDGSTQNSESEPLPVTIRRAQTTTVFKGITEDVVGGKVRVDVGVNGQDPDLGGPGEIVLIINGTDVATQATDKLAGGSFVLDAANLPHGMLVVGARYTGSNWHAPSEKVTGWEHTQKVFIAPNPALTGTPEVDSALRVTLGTWFPSPASVTYTWQADGAPIAGMTGPTPKIPATALGKQITVQVTGKRPGYPEKTMSSLPTTAVVAAAFTAPTPAIKGTATVGATLTVSRGAWSPAPSSVKYVWKANGMTISTQGISTFVVPASAKGKRLTVTVVGSRAGYTTRSMTSAATSTVTAGTFTAPRPAITGTKRVGYTLSVSRGTWSPQPTSVTYVWKANGVRIATRSSNRFVIPAAARGKRLTVTVTGTRAGYTTKSVTSDRTVAVR